MIRGEANLGMKGVVKMSVSLTFCYIVISCTDRNLQSKILYTYVSVLLSLDWPLIYLMNLTLILKLTVVIVQRLYNFTI